MGMTDWNGTFLRKHITTISFRDLQEMRDEDWGVLDFPELTEEALERLVDKIMCGGTTGFYQVDVDMHKARTHGGKPRYFYPGTGQGDEPDPDFDGVDEPESDPDTKREFRRRYNELDKLTEAGLQGELTKRGFSPRKIRSWPRWAMIITIIALQRREEGFRCD